MFRGGATRNGGAIQVGGIVELAEFPLTLYDAAVTFAFVFTLALSFGLLSHRASFGVRRPEGSAEDSAHRVVGPPTRIPRPASTWAACLSLS